MKSGPSEFVFVRTNFHEVYHFYVFVLSLLDGYWSGFTSAQLKSNGVIIAGTDGGDEVIGKGQLLTIEHRHCSHR